MSHAHAPAGAHDARAHLSAHGAGEGAPGEEFEPAPLSASPRYEIEDLFHGEAPENLHFLKVLGLVVLVVLMGIALAYPFLFLGN